LTPSVNDFRQRFFSCASPGRASSLKDSSPGQRSQPAQRLRGRWAYRERFPCSGAMCSVYSSLGHFRQLPGLDGLAGIHWLCWRQRRTTIMSNPTMMRIATPGGNRVVMQLILDSLGVFSCRFLKPQSRRSLALAPGLMQPSPGRTACGTGRRARYRQRGQGRRPLHGRRG
jgi:hypothetical protein